MTPDKSPKTLYQKIWDAHVVHEEPGKPALLYIDRHLVHEGTSPQAFAGLSAEGRKVRRPDLTFAVMDHSVPTTDRTLPIIDTDARLQFDALEKNCRESGVRLFDMHSRHQGIVHVIGPELGLTQPGMTIVCGDSHTSTHGAFGAMAFGIGSSEVEHVLATQCLPQRRLSDVFVNIEGRLPVGVTAKDIVVGLIAQEGTAGGQGHNVEYRGSTIRDLSMEGRMTVCNMTIEWGARVGMVAPDDTTFAYLQPRRHAPKGKQWEEALDYWRTLQSDPDAEGERETDAAATRLEPFVTWGTNPGQAVPITGRVPEARDETAERALRYMDLKAGTAMQDIAIDRVFIGSCTNSRIEDLRLAADVVRGRNVHPRVRAMVVPGSATVKLVAESEGLDKVFEDAGFEWRDAGCSMCLRVNPHIPAPGERCPSTSHRNFEGRQGAGGRTHPVTPPMAAAAPLARPPPHRR